MTSVPIAVGIAVIATAAGPHLPLAGSQKPLNLRSLVHAPVQPRQAPNPLEEVRALLAQPDQTEFTVAAARPEDWRLAVLDTYDGQTWSARPSFQSVGTQVPGAASPGGTTLPQHIAVHALDGYFLPAATRPSAITMAGVGYSPSTGVLVTARSTVRGLRYDVTSIVPQAPTLAQIVRYSAKREPTSSPLTYIPSACPALGPTARNVVATGGYDFQRLALLQRYLNAHPLFAYNVNAPSGESCGHLAFFLGTSGRQGTDEQFANAFAVMARSLGYATRVVVGFRPGSKTTRGGSFIVHGSDAHAWPEVLFNGLGWFPFDPTPSSAVTVHPSAKSEFVVSADQAANQAVQTPPPKARKPAHRPGSRRQPGSRGSGGSTNGLLVLLILVAALVMAGILAVLALKWRRRNARRHAPDSRGRVVGAWHEVLDRLADGGVAHVETLCVSDVIQRAEPIAGTEAGAGLKPLGVLVNRALFAEVAPSEQEASDAWSYADGFVGAWGHSRRFSDQIRAGLSVRAIRSARSRSGSATR